MNRLSFNFTRCHSKLYRVFAPIQISDTTNTFTNSIGQRYIVAVLGAWAAESVTYPLDLAKTRLQIQSELATAKHGYKMENLGLFSTALNIAKKEGVPKLWAGISAMLQRHLVYAGSRLVIYEQLRAKFRDHNGYLSVGWTSFCGMTAGALAQFIASPPDIVKVLMQAEGRRVLQGKPKRFNNVRQVYKMVYKESGIRGFWRGAIPNMQRTALVNLGDLATYDFTKQALMREFAMPDTILTHFISAYVAGFTAATLATPADVLKTRMMNQPVGKDGKGKLYKSMIDCLQQSVKNEGVFALYKGFMPMWIRLGPWALINWLVFENVMLAIGGKTF